VLCFVRTKHGASRLARQLEKDGLVTDAIHGDKSQQTRMQALAAFKEGKLEVLVATDVAARGLDIDDLPVVVNYELPHVPEDYIHRIGRTGRAGATGEAISFVAPEEEKYLADIERLLKKKDRDRLGCRNLIFRRRAHLAFRAFRHSAHPDRRIDLRARAARQGCVGQCAQNCVGNSCERPFRRLPRVAAPARRISRSAFIARRFSCSASLRAYTPALNAIARMR
jgi:superfamily II DNA/RNA helicase